MNTLEASLQSKTYQNLQINVQPLKQYSETLAEQLSPIKSELDKIQEICQPVNNYVREYLSPYFSTIPKIPDEILNISFNIADTIKSATSILNLPNAKSYFKNLNISPEFCTAYERLIKILNFPVVQSTITEEQLLTRLNHMDDKELSDVKTTVNDMIEHSPKKLKLKKELLLQVIKKLAVSVTFAMTTEILKRIILMLFGQLIELLSK